MTTAALLIACFAAGLLAQRAQASGLLRGWAWNVSFFVVSPIVAFYAFSEVTLGRDLALAVAAAIAASWFVLGISYLYARRVAPERDELGALALGGAFGNTGSLGYPLALVLFGTAGLADMVVYSQLAWLVPSIAVSTTVARLHGSGLHERASLWRAILRNPPLLAAVTALALRRGEVELSASVDVLRQIAEHVVGPLGLFQVGLALPLERLVYRSDEILRAAGVFVIRFGCSPLVLLGCAAVVGADIPPAFYLGAAMPCAFHLLILARVFGLRPQLMRLLVVGSSVPVVVGVFAVAALAK